MIFNIDKTIEKFKQNYSKDKKTNCWNYKIGKTKNGYAMISVNYKKFYAHRFSFLIHNGHLPKKLLICHKCDNRKCVNPDHLWIGTHKDNTRDMMKKGRSRFSKKKTHCKRGHAFVGENIVIKFHKPSNSYKRNCRECRRIWDRKFKKQTRNK